MRNLYLAIALGFSMVACQGADNGKNKKEGKEDEEVSLTGQKKASGDLEDRYQNALLSDTEVEEKEDSEDEEKKEKVSGLAGMIMGLFDKNGDSMLSVDELNLLVKFTKNLVAKIALPDLMKPEKKPQDGDKEKEDKEPGTEPKPEKPDVKGSIKDKIFACMDKNSDGSISKDEFSEAKGPFALHKCMMGKMDKDEDKKDEAEDKKDQTEEKKEDEKD